MVADASVPRVDILGVKVHRLDMETAAGMVEQYLASGTPHFIVTADTSMIALAQSDCDLREVIGRADLVTPDSTGILLGARCAGEVISERVSGIDLCARIFEICAREGYPVFLFGAKPGIADQAAQNAVQQYPGLVIAGTRDGYFEETESDAIADEVCASGARVLLVALGIPKQELWIDRNLGRLGVSVAMGVGGSLDVLSGQVKRAPIWMQKCGMEWLYRLRQDPSKITKVAVLPGFFWMVLTRRRLA